MKHLHIWINRATTRASHAVCDNRPLAMQRAMLIVDDEEAARYALARVFQDEFRAVEAIPLPRLGNDFGPSASMSSCWITTCRAKTGWHC